MPELTVPMDMVSRMIELPRLRSQNNNDMQPLLDLMPDNCQVAELGCFAGECSVQFLRSKKVSQLVCVDWWKGEYDTDDLASGADMRAAQIAFNIRTMLWRDTAKLQVYPASTQWAATYFPDHSFDMIYLDADHRYASVVADIRAWLPKLKPGGCFAGHDYSSKWHQGVMRAVNDVLGPPHIVFPDTSWAIKIERT